MNLSSEDLDAAKYTKRKRVAGVSGLLLNTVLILLMLLLGVFDKLENFSYSITSNSYAAFLIFAVSAMAILSIAGFPLSFYRSYLLEHKFGLSNQTLSGYLLENIKGMFVAAILGLPVLLLFYFSIRNFQENWWLVFGLFILAVNILLNYIAPVLILPLFYKLTPIEDERINSAINDVSDKAGIHPNGIFSFNMSKNTKKVNAAFTGLGRSKRIILADNLLREFEDDEIAVVYAHEAGHYYHNHLVKLMAFSVILTFAVFFLSSFSYNAFIGYFNYNSPYDISALPALGLILGAVSLLLSPLGNILSRKYEYEADRFALRTTLNKSAFISAMKKLAQLNLAETSPNKVIEFLFHTHPSIHKRIRVAEDS